MLTGGIFCSGWIGLRALRRRCSHLFVMALTVCGLASALLVDNPTTYWTPIVNRNAAGDPVYPDAFNDQQTGVGEGDIVGDALHPSFYVSFDDAGTPGVLTDGTMAFRVRVAQGNTSFDRSLFVGIDVGEDDCNNTDGTTGADGIVDGDMDLYIGISKDSSTIEIFGPGSDRNISPSTTSITPLDPPVTYVADASNFHWSAVDAALDPEAAVFDVDADGNTDYFVSMSVPFADVVSALSSYNVDENTAMRFLAATATQGNSLNQDINGPNNKTMDTSASWETLGASSEEVVTSSLAPEPGSLCLFALAGLLLCRRPGRR